MKLRCCLSKWIDTTYTWIGPRCPLGGLVGGILLGVFVIVVLAIVMPPLMFIGHYAALVIMPLYGWWSNIFTW